MASVKLLTVQPQQLRFAFELKKQIPCMMQLRNDSDHFVAFKVKTTNPTKYCVKPNIGVVPPHSTSDVIVTMQAQAEVPPDMFCKDKFLIQSIVTSEEMTAKDLTPDKFDSKLGHYVEVTKLTSSYHLPEEIVEDASSVDSADDLVASLMRTYKAVSKEVEENIKSLERLHGLLHATRADLKRHGVEMPSE